MAVVALIPVFFTSFLFLNAVSALYLPRFPLYQINVFCTPMIVDSGPGAYYRYMAWEIRAKSTTSLISLSGIWAAHIAPKVSGVSHYDFFTDFPALAFPALSASDTAFLCREYRRKFTLHSLPPVAVRCG